VKTAQKNDSEAFTITGNWILQAKILKQRYTELTEADLLFEPGGEIDLLMRIESRLHKRRIEVMGIIRKGNIKTV